MGVTSGIIIISPLETLKKKYQWKPVFIKFGDRPEDIENYFTSRQSKDISLVLMYCALEKIGRNKIIETLRKFLCVKKYKSFFNKVTEFDLHEIYIGGIKYTDTWFLKQKGWIEEKRA